MPGPPEADIPLDVDKIVTLPDPGMRLAPVYEKVPVDPVGEYVKLTAGVAEMELASALSICALVPVKGVCGNTVTENCVGFWLTVMVEEVPLVAETAPDEPPPVMELKVGPLITFSGPI